MNNDWKGCGRKWLCQIKDAISAFAWRDWGKSQKPVDIQSGLGLNLGVPDWLQWSVFTNVK